MVASASDQLKQTAGSRFALAIQLHLLPLDKQARRLLGERGMGLSITHR